MVDFNKDEPDMAADLAADLLSTLGKVLQGPPIEPAAAAGKFLDEDMYDGWQRIAKAAGVPAFQFASWVRLAVAKAKEAGHPIAYADHATFCRSAREAGAVAGVFAPPAVVFDPLSPTGRADASSSSSSSPVGDLAAVAAAVPAMLDRLFLQTCENAAATADAPPCSVVVVGPRMSLHVGPVIASLAASLRYFVVTDPAKAAAGEAARRRAAVLAFLELRHAGDKAAYDKAVAAYDASAKDAVDA